MFRTFVALGQALLCIPVALALDTPGSGSPEKGLNPFQVAHLAYRGEFKEQGIDSYGALCDDFLTGSVDGADVAAAAAKKGLVSKSSLEDAGFSRAISGHLWNLCKD